MHKKDETKENDFGLFRRIEFSSDRKRMSILVRDPIDMKIKLYVKGADSEMMGRLDPNIHSEEELESLTNFLN